MPSIELRSISEVEVLDLGQQEAGLDHEREGICLVFRMVDQNVFSVEPLAIFGENQKLYSGPNKKAGYRSGTTIRTPLSK